MDDEDRTQNSLQLAEADIHTLVQPKAAAVSHAPNPIAIANGAQNPAGSEDGAVALALAPQGAGANADAEGESTEYSVCCEALMLNNEHQILVKSLNTMNEGFIHSLSPDNSVSKYAQPTYGVKIFKKVATRYSCRTKTG